MRGPGRDDGAGLCVRLVPLGQVERTQEKPLDIAFDCQGAEMLGGGGHRGGSWDCCCCDALNLSQTALG